MSGILELVTSSLGGSIVGAAGAAFSKWHEGKLKLEEMKLNLEQTKLNNSHDLSMAQITQAGNREEAEEQFRKAALEVDYAGLEASILADRATYSTADGSKWLVLVDVVRGLVRPVLTASLLIYCMAALLYITRHYSVELTNEQLYNIVVTIVNNLVTCSSIALTWWFGTRSNESKGK